MFYEEPANDQEFWSNLFNLLNKILCLQDDLQQHRVTYAFEQCLNYNLFDQMGFHQETNECKLYKIIKFITELYHQLV